MKYDLIMVTASRNNSFIQMTQNAIDSCLKDGADVNVIIVETACKHQYARANEIVMYEGEFNYNRALNQGLRKAKGDIHILANNDILFTQGWSTIGDTMQANGFLSASALSNDQRQRAYKRGDYYYEGYRIGCTLTGWCLFVDRQVIKTIKKLDETYKFWCSDDVYADQLIKNGIRHALICNCTVLHLGSRTLLRESRQMIHKLTMGDYAKRKKILTANTKDLQKEL